jgi:hypothetical protein
MWTKEPSYRRPNTANSRSSISSEKPPSSGWKSSRLLPRHKNYDREFLRGSSRRAPEAPFGSSLVGETWQGPY